MNLTLVRHGEPERMPTDPRDPGLCDRGRAQARATGRHLRFESYDGVYSSPQLRAVQTARILAPGGGRQVTLDAGLVEFDYGAEYVHFDNASDPLWRHYFAGDLSPWGLTATSFHERIRSALQSIAELHPAGNVLAVCHGGVINAWTCRVLGVPERIRIFEPKYAALNRYSQVAGQWRVVSLNESIEPALDK